MSRKREGWRAAARPPSRALYLPKKKIASPQTWPSFVVRIGSGSSDVVTHPVDSPDERLAVVSHFCVGRASASVWLRGDAVGRYRGSRVGEGEMK